MDKTELIKKLNLSQKEVMAYLKMASLSEKEIFDDEDMKKIALMMTLKRLGFSDEKIGCFMECPYCRLTLLNQQRALLLDQLHDKQKLLDDIDYLIHDLKRKESEK